MAPLVLLAAAAPAQVIAAELRLLRLLGTREHLAEPARQGHGESPSGFRNKVFQCARTADLFLHAQEVDHLLDARDLLHGAQSERLPLLVRKRSTEAHRTIRGLHLDVDRKSVV